MQTTMLYGLQQKEEYITIYPWWKYLEIDCLEKTWDITYGYGILPRKSVDSDNV